MHPRFYHQAAMEGAFRHRVLSRLALALLALLMACTAKGEGKPGNALDEGRRVLAAPELPPRREVVALAHALVAEAEREGGASARDKRVTAAGLFERAYRLHGEPDDGEAAVSALVRASSEGAPDEESCKLRLRGARLRGEVSRHPQQAGEEAEKGLRAVSDAGIPDAGTRDSECTRDLAELSRLGKLFRGETGAKAGLAHVLGVEAWPGNDASRLVIAVDRAIPYTITEGTDGAMKFIEVEAPGATMDRLPPLLQVGGVVSHVTVAFEKGSLRIRAYLPGQAFRRAFHLPEPFRIVLDIARQLPGKHAPRTISRVALDAGHGGSDPGALGPSGLREKDVTLDIVHKLAPILAKSGISVVLTRDADQTVSLEERTARVNSSQADLFISIHCNASEKPESHGVETYVLDTEHDVVASRVAARENGSSIAATREVGTILASMKIEDQGLHATHFAELLQRSALTSMRMKAGNVRDGGVKQAGFYVLVGARMPSVLFEASYISNPDEESRLASPEYRQRIADGIANAVRAYKEGH